MFVYLRVALVDGLPHWDVALDFIMLTIELFQLLELHLVETDLTIDR